MTVDPCPGLLGRLEAALGVPPVGVAYSPEVLDAIRAANQSGCDVMSFRTLFEVYAKQLLALVPTTTLVTTTTAPVEPPFGSGGAGPGRTSTTTKAAGSGPCRSDASVVLSGRLTDDMDGDSFVIGTTEVRLSIVNTPEWDQAGGAEATRFTVDWFGSSTVDVYRPAGAPTRDHYGRLLGDVVRRSDCSSLAVELVRNGHGEPMDAYCREDPGLARQVGC